MYITNTVQLQNHSKILFEILWLSSSILFKISRLSPDWKMLPNFVSFQVDVGTWTFLFLIVAMETDHLHTDLLSTSLTQYKLRHKWPVWRQIFTININYKINYIWHNILKTFTSHHLLSQIRGKLSNFWFKAAHFWTYWPKRACFPGYGPESCRY